MYNPCFPRRKGKKLCYCYTSSAHAISQSHMKQYASMIMKEYTLCIFTWEWPLFRGQVCICTQLILCLKQWCSLGHQVVSLTPESVVTYLMYFVSNWTLLVFVTNQMLLVQFTNASVVALYGAHQHTLALNILLISLKSLV